LSWFLLKTEKTNKKTNKKERTQKREDINMMIFIWHKKRTRTKNETSRDYENE